MSYPRENIHIYEYTGHNEIILTREGAIDDDETLAVMGRSHGTFISFFRDPEYCSSPHLVAAAYKNWFIFRENS